MQKVKLFKSLESDLPALESEINTWLSESGARVVSITGNVAPQSAMVGASSSVSLARAAHSASDVFVIILYETP